MSETIGLGNQGELNQLRDKYAVLLSALRNYFPTQDDPTDKSEEFIKDYRMFGEGKIEYKGLMDQLTESVQRPVEFSTIMNYTMGYDFTPDATREYMVDLYNRLTQTDENLIRAKTDPDARLGYWFFRKVHIPFKVPYFENDIPLWVGLAFSFLVSAIGYLGFEYLRVPVIHQIFLFILVIGTLGFALVALIMYYLRDEVVNYDKYQEQELDLEAYKDRRQKKKSASRWRLRN